MRLKSKKWRLITWATLITFSSTLFYQPVAQGFKIKTHVYTSNIAMIDAMDGNIYLQGFQEFPGISGIVSLGNPELVEAIQKYPNIVRAGALGPDGFPDLIWGQQLPHVNHGKFEEGGEPSMLRKWLGKDGNRHNNISSNANFFVGGVRDMDDPFTWRSIDHGMFILSKALEYHADAAPGSREYELHLQALAFGYGYLVHVAGDAFAHSFVNEGSGGFFNLFGGEGLYGAATEEIKHIAIETLIDKKFTGAVFREQKYILDPPNKRDARMPGNNAVVAPLEGFAVQNHCKETAQERSWFYCNPLAAVEGNRNTGQDCSPQNLRDANPWGDCNPWETVCRPADYLSDLNRLRTDLEECTEPSTPGARGLHAKEEGGSGLAGFWGLETDKQKEKFLDNLSNELITNRERDLFDLTGLDKDICGIAYLGPLLTELPEACDPNNITIRENRRGEMEVLNECIQINCMYDASKCPTPAVKGWEDRGMRADVECTESIAFGSLGNLGNNPNAHFEYPQELQNFLKSVKINIPSDFLTKVFVENPDDPSVELRNLAGPHIKVLQFLRNLLNKVANNKWIKLLTLNPIDFVRAAGSLIRSTDIPILSEAIGWPLEKIGEIIHDVLGFIGDLVCKVTFGLFCPKPDLPILNLSLFLKERADIVQEQLYRWEDLNYCIGQNLLNGANLPPGQEMTKGDDACRQFEWWMNHWDKYRENVQGLISNGLDAVGIPVERDDYNPGSVINALDKMQAFFLDETFGEVLSLHRSDFGVEGWLADAAWMVLEIVVFDILLLPFKIFLDYAKKKIKEALFDHFVPEAVKIYFKAEGASAETFVNIAFLKEDFQKDRAYFNAVKASTSNIPAVDNFSPALLDQIQQGRSISAEQQMAVAVAVKKAMTDAENAGRPLVGPKLRGLKNILKLRSREDNLTVNRFTPLYNAIQLNKLAWLGQEGVLSLAGSASSLDANRLNTLFPGAFGISGNVIPMGEKVCFEKTNGNLMCEGVPSLDDPDNYGHPIPMMSGVGVGSPAAIIASIRPTTNYDRSVVLDRMVMEQTTRPTYGFKVYDLTNFIPLQSETNATRIYGQIFAPYHCNNNPLSDVDADRDGIFDNCDNCVNVFNPGQEDKDQNGVGDNCILGIVTPRGRTIDLRSKQPSFKLPKGVEIKPVPGFKQQPGLTPSLPPRERPPRVPPPQPLPSPGPSPGPRR